MKLYKSKTYLLQQTKIKSYSQIAKENNVDIATIYRTLKEFGLTKSIKRWTLNELNILKKDYSKDITLLNRIKGRSLSAIYHKASRLKIPREVRPLKYKIDVDFFKEWSKELAYFLGFFMADGHLNLKAKKVSIKLQKRDYYILEKFLNLLKTNRSLSYFAGYPTFIIP